MWKMTQQVVNQDEIQWCQTKLCQTFLAHPEKYVMAYTVWMTGLPP